MLRRVPTRAHNTEAAALWCGNDVPGEWRRRMGFPSANIARTPSAHQRKAVCAKGLAGAASVVGPCIAVIGLVPGSV
jgi:hypothetical protein